MRRLLAAPLAVVVLAGGLRDPRRPRRRAGDPHPRRPPRRPCPSRSRRAPSRPPPLPTPAPSAAPLEPAALSAALPAPTVLRRQLADELSDPALGPSLGVTVRDAFTDAHLLDIDTATPRVPASTAKLLTALAVGVTLDPASTLPTRVVQGRTPSEIVLVAGGDSLLGPWQGQPDRCRRAGRARRPRRPGGDRPAGGRDGRGHRAARHDVCRGAALCAGLEHGRRVCRLHPGGVDARPRRRSAPTRAGRPRCARRTRCSRRSWLRFRRGASPRRRPPRAPAPSRHPAGAAELGRVESAPVGDVLALALDDSDNALTESLARQASVKAGGAATFEAAVSMVRRAVSGLGVDLTGRAAQGHLGPDLGPGGPGARPRRRPRPRGRAAPSRRCATPWPSCPWRGSTARSTTGSTAKTQPVGGRDRARQDRHPHRRQQPGRHRRRPRRPGADLRRPRRPGARRLRRNGRGPGRVGPLRGCSRVLRVPLTYGEGMSMSETAPAPDRWRAPSTGSSPRQPEPASSPPAPR